MLIQSDWHIHSEYSFDAPLSLAQITETANEYGFKKIGITDHANYNDESFLGDLDRSATNVTEWSRTHQNVVLGVELTPIEKPEFDYIAIHGTSDGFVPPPTDKPYDIELAQTKEQLVARGVRYAIGAAHWRVDSPVFRHWESLAASDIHTLIKEFHRQQLWLACDERVTILGHPWHISHQAWYQDFSFIPRSMNEELAAALKENRKFVECNGQLMCHPRATERFRRQYAEFIRELFEMGIPVTYGSDTHSKYEDFHLQMEAHLRAVGFVEGDFSELTDEHLW